MLTKQDIDRIRNEPPLEIPEQYSNNEQMAGMAYEYAHKILVEQGNKELLPTWALLTENGRVVVIGTPFEGPGNYKDAIATLLRKTMRDLGVIRYTFVSEAWTVRRDPGEYEGRAPVDCDDRIEVVLVVAADKQGSFLRMYEIERNWDDGRITNLKLVDKGEGGDSVASGRFANLLPTE